MTQRAVGFSGKQYWLLPIVFGLLWSYRTTSANYVVIDPLVDPNRGGFEIGNGRTLVRNLAGQYSINVPNRWEAGLSEKLTEIIAPLNEGTPRTRLQINVLNANGITSITELLNRKNDWHKWTSIEHSVGTSGIKRITSDNDSEDDHVPPGYQGVDLEILSQNKLVVISVLGKTNSEKTMQEIHTMMQSFKISDAL